MSVCDTCRCPLAGDSARLLVAQNSKGVWGAMRCRQCGHMASMFDVDGLEFAPADDPRWVPLAKSPAVELKAAQDAAGAAAWIRAAITTGKRWTQKIRKEATDEQGDGETPAGARQGPEEAQG